MEHLLVQLEMHEEEINLLKFMSISSVEFQLVLFANNSTRLLYRVENVVQVIVDDAAARDKIAPNRVLWENKRYRLDVLVCPPVLVVVARRVDLALEDRKGGIFVLLRRRRERDVRRDLDLANYLRLCLTELAVLQ